MIAYTHTKRDHIHAQSSIFQTAKTSWPRQSWPITCVPETCTLTQQEMQVHC